MVFILKIDLIKIETIFNTFLMQTYLSLLQKEIIYENLLHSAVKIQLIEIKYYKNKLMLHKNTEMRNNKTFVVK